MGCPNCGKSMRQVDVPMFGRPVAWLGRLMILVSIVTGAFGVRSLDQVMQTGWSYEDAPGFPEAMAVARARAIPFAVMIAAAAVWLVLGALFRSTRSILACADCGAAIDRVTAPL